MGKNIESANRDLNELVNFIKDNNLWFDNITYDTFDSTDVDVYQTRSVDNDTIDVETRYFIITFHRRNNNIDFGYNISNDIILGINSEVELISGYMDNCNIKNINNRFIFEQE